MIIIKVFCLSVEPRSDYTPIANYPLPFTESKRKICLNLVILEDAIIENDESFSIMLERNSSVSTTVPLLIEPEISTVKIMDNDGKSTILQCINWPWRVKQGLHIDELNVNNLYVRMYM